jgi:hypothetical protein
MKREAEAQSQEVIEIAHSVWSDVLFPSFKAKWIMRLRSVNKEWNRTIPPSIQVLPMVIATKYIKDFRTFVSLCMLRVSSGFLTKENFWKYGTHKVFGKLSSLHISIKAGEPFYEKMVKYATNLTSLNYDSTDRRYKAIQSYLPTMTTLKHLSIYDNFGDNAYKCIGDMTQLVTLRLDIRPRNDRTIVPGIDNMLCQLTGLEYLSLSTTYTTYSFLKHTTNLQYLSLCGTQCCDVHGEGERCGLLSVSNLPDLRALIFGSDIPLASVDWILSIKSLSYLCISGPVPQLKNGDMNQSTIGLINFTPKLQHVETYFDEFLQFVSSLSVNTLLGVKISVGTNNTSKKSERVRNYHTIVPKFMKRPENFITFTKKTSPFTRYLASVQFY